LILYAVPYTVSGGRSLQKEKGGGHEGFHRCVDLGVLAAVRVAWGSGCLDPAGATAQVKIFGNFQVPGEYSGPRGPARGIRIQRADVPLIHRLGHDDQAPVIQP